MRKIEFIEELASAQREVCLSEVPGMADKGWHIYIDRLYHGLIKQRGGKWVALIDNGLITPADGARYAEMVEVMDEGGGFVEDCKIEYQVEVPELQTMFAGKA